MANQFTLPDMGDIQSGVVASILVSEGDSVQEETPVLELETDKATQEVPSTVTGKVGKILVKPGDSIKVGAPIFELAGDGASTSDASPSKVEMQEEPRATNGQSNGTATDTHSRTSETSDKPKALVPDDAPAPPTPETKAPAAPQLSEVARREIIPAAPNVRRIAREMGVDIREVKGSGPDARISAADVQMFANPPAQPVTPQAPSEPRILSVPLPDFTKFGEVERVEMKGIRKATSDQMQRAWSSVPAVTQFDKIDISAVEKLRKQYAKQAEEAGGKLTVTALALKAVVAALKKFPSFNASVDIEANEIVYKKYFHIGVAVDTPNGLLVPVIRDVDRKGIFELARELGEVAAKARDKKLGLLDMSGGSFTITNLGGIGGTHFTPIVNVPEVAILGMSRAVMEPVWNKETSAFEPKMMMPVSLSYDHRIIDGADGARFTRFLASVLEDPFLLALT